MVGEVRGGFKKIVKINGEDFCYERGVTLVRLHSKPPRNFVAHGPCPHRLGLRTRLVARLTIWITRSDRISLTTRNLNKTYSKHEFRTLIYSAHLSIYVRRAHINFCYERGVTLVRLHSKPPRNFVAHGPCPHRLGLRTRLVARLTIWITRSDLISLTTRNLNKTYSKHEFRTPIYSAHLSIYVRRAHINV